MARRLERPTGVTTNMRCFGMLMDGRAQSTGVRQRGKNATMLLVHQRAHELVEFTLPECPVAAKDSIDRRRMSRRTVRNRVRPAKNTSHARSAFCSCSKRRRRNNRQASNRFLSLSYRHTVVPGGRQVLDMHLVKAETARRARACFWFVSRTFAGSIPASGFPS